MPKSGKDARLRLRQAAVELFLERGYDAVTTAEIARRAGVNERTYFRHFVDKREVIFSEEHLLAEALTVALAAVPQGAAPLPALVRAFSAILPMIEANRPVIEPMARVVAETPALRERQALKGARLVEILSESLRDRGVDMEVAAIAAQTGWVILAQAMHWWMEDSTGGLEAAVTLAFQQLRSIAGEPD